jgi:hypothetical protein
LAHNNNQSDGLRPKLSQGWNRKNPEPQSFRDFRQINGDCVESSGKLLLWDAGRATKGGRRFDQESPGKNYA